MKYTAVATELRTVVEKESCFSKTPYQRSLVGEAMDNG
jgi:hypothetical protein